MKKREQGILTVEASIVLTLMLLFILFLFSFGRVYRAQNLVSHATLQSADAVALESYLRETALQSDVSEVVHLASHITESSAISAESLESLRSANLPKIARQKFIAAIASSESKADEKLKSMGVKNGLAGVDFSECKIDLANDDVIIAIRYTIEMQFPVFGFNEITVTKAAKAKTFGEILFEVSTEPNQPGWGSTSGDDKVVHGSTVQITATPNYGYKFVGWDDGNTDNPRTVTVTDAQHYIAIFERDSFGINISKKIQCDEAFRGINHTNYGSFTGARNYLYLDNAVLTATPSEPNYQFKGWDINGDGTIDNANSSITITVDKTYNNIVAVFAPSKFTVSVKSNNNSYGTVQVSQGTKKDSSISVEYGSNVQLMASPNSDLYLFDRWSNSATNASTTVTVKNNVTYTANFIKNTYTVTFKNGSSVHETVEVIRGSSIDGSVGKISTKWPSNPSQNGVTFKEWSYSGSKFLSNSKVYGNITVNAKYQYTVDFKDSNGNRLSSSITKDVGSKVTIPSVSKAGYNFNGWKNGNNSYAVGSSYEINKNITLTGSFTCNHKTVSGSTGYKISEYYKADQGQGGNAANDSCKYYRKNICQRCGDVKEDYSRANPISHADVQAACRTKHSCNEEGQICIADNGNVITHTRTSKYCIRCQYCGRRQNKIYVYNKKEKCYEWRYAYWCGQHADLTNKPRVDCPGINSSGGTITIQ